MNVDVPEGYPCGSCGAIVDTSYHDSGQIHGNLHDDIDMLLSKVKELEERVNKLAELT
jgi:hypothetical protein